jgi:hypothetical protein
MGRPEFKPQYHQKTKTKKNKDSQTQWLMPVFLLTQEAEIRGITIQGQPRQKC